MPYCSPKNSVSSTFGLTDTAYPMTTPRIATDKFLKWIKSTLERKKQLSPLLAVTLSLDFLASTIARGTRPRLLPSMARRMLSFHRIRPTKLELQHGMPGRGHTKRLFFLDADFSSASSKSISNARECTVTRQWRPH